MVYSFPPLQLKLCQIGRQFLSVVDNSSLGHLIWFGLMSGISLLDIAGWGGEGEWGNKLPISLHYTLLRERGRVGGCVPSP